MKKLWIIALVLMCLIFSIGYSQDVHYARSITITWDAVTTYAESGDLIDPLDIVSYQVYLRDRNTGANITISEIVDTVLTFSYDRGAYDVGVSAIIETVEGWRVENPDVTWSIMEDEIRVPGGPWYAVFLEAANAVEGLRINP